MLQQLQAGFFFLNRFTEKSHIPLSSERGCGCLINRDPPLFREIFRFQKNSVWFPASIPSPTGSVIAPEIPQFVITAAARWGLGGTPIASVPAFMNLPEVSHLGEILDLYFMS